jgi:hypothetical protein
MTLEFFDRFSKNAQISNFMKMRPVGAELFHSHRRTGMKLTVAFRNFVNTPKLVLCATDIYQHILVTAHDLPT